MSSAVDDARVAADLARRLAGDAHVQRSHAVVVVRLAQAPRRLAAGHALEAVLVLALAELHVVEDETELTVDRPEISGSAETSDVTV